MPKGKAYKGERYKVAAKMPRRGKRAHNREDEGVFHGKDLKDGYRKILVPKLWEHEREEA